MLVYRLFVELESLMRVIRKLVILLAVLVFQPNPALCAQFVGLQFVDDLERSRVLRIAYSELGYRNWLSEHNSGACAPCFDFQDGLQEYFGDNIYVIADAAGHSFEQANKFSDEILHFIFSSAFLKERLVSYLNNGTDQDILKLKVNLFYAGYKTGGFDSKLDRETLASLREYLLTDFTFGSALWAYKIGDSSLSRLVSRVGIRRFGSAGLLPDFSESSIPGTSRTFSASEADRFYNDEIKFIQYVIQLRSQDYTQSIAKIDKLLEERS